MIKKAGRKKQKRQLLLSMIAAGMKPPTMIPAVAGCAAVNKRSAVTFLEVI